MKATMGKAFRSLVQSFLIVLIVGLGTTTPVCAQQASEYVPVQQSEQYVTEVTQARKWIDSLMQAQNIPGIQVAVWGDGEVVWSDGFGYADVEHRVPVWPYTKMRIGSVSKTLTSAAIGKLVEEGRLDLDKPVQAYVSYFPEKEYTITTRQVAGHLAGIRHYRGDEFLSDKFYPTVEEGIQIFADDTLLFKPGEDYSYSSYGWNLVSGVVEEAAGQPFLSYMEEEVFAPLEMNNTVAEFMDRIIYHRSGYYTKNEQGRLLNAPHVDNSYKWAGGGFIGTAEDLLKFGEAMLGDEYLEQETIAMLWESQQTNDGERTDYGIGWASGTDAAGHRWVGHSGGSVGGTTQFVIFPGQKVIVAMISNLSSVSYGDVHLHIANLFMEEDR